MLDGLERACVEIWDEENDGMLCCGMAAYSKRRRFSLPKLILSTPDTDMMTRIVSGETAVSAIDYREFEGPIDEVMLLRLGTLAERVFAAHGQPAPVPTDVTNQLRVAINGHRWVHLGTACIDGELVGFKVGRSNDPRTFESWSGGVLPDARQQGIASQLARMQEAWCRAQGFQFIQTETAHDNRAMLTVNLKAGFCITGTRLDRGTNLKVVLQKQLD